MSLVAQYSEFGPASVIRLVDIDPPVPGPGRIRVAVRAAGLNPRDYKEREGSHSGPGFSLPAGVGYELAGVVESLGEGVTAVSVGDEVFGTVAGSAVAELVVTDPANMARKPPELDWATAGGLALAGQTAFDSVASQHLTSDDTVFVSAAAGGVGVVVCQLALRAGARVIGSAGPANHDFLASLGVIPVSYGPGVVEAVRAAAPGGVTVAFDHNGRDSVEAAIELGVPRDRINTVAMDPADLGVVRVGRGPFDAKTLATLAGLVAAGELVIPIEATYPLAGIVAAFERLESGHLRGKVVVVVKDDE
jgi:NADPH:quinone reductase-like Zn-dependent oxidoreductase